MATQVFSRVNDHCSSKNYVKKQFEYPVLKDFCRNLEFPGKQEPFVPELLPAEVRTLYPLSFAQERLWFLDRLIPDNPFYNISKAIQMRDKLNLNALKESVHEIVRLHHTLRTYFTEENKTPSQKISGSFDIPLDVINLESLTDKIKKESLLITEESRKIFELTQSPMIRVNLFRLGLEHHIFTCIIHHIVSDEWSTGILFHELGEFCTGHILKTITPPS